MTKDQARDRGYTREVYADSWDVNLELLVQEDVDFDADFLAYDLNTGEMLTVHGYNLTFHDLNEAEA